MLISISISCFPRHIQINRRLSGITRDSGRAVGAPGVDELAAVVSKAARDSTRLRKATLSETTGGTMCRRRRAGQPVRVQRKFFSLFFQS